jgi:hypothetical protein
MRVPKEKLEVKGNCPPAWQIEEAILSKLSENWEKMTPEQRAKAFKKANPDLRAMRGASAAGLGGAAMLGADALFAFFGYRAASLALVGTVFAPVAAIGGAGWTAYELAGPAYRVLQRVIVMIGWTRLKLRYQRIATAYEN